MTTAREIAMNLYFDLEAIANYDLDNDNNAATLTAHNGEELTIQIFDDADGETELPIIYGEDGAATIEAGVEAITNWANNNR